MIRSMTWLSVLLAASLAHADELPIIDAQANSAYPGLPIANAVDGNPTTFWAGENALAPPWIIDLEVEPALLDQLEIDWYADYGAASFNVQTSQDGISYVAATSGGLAGMGNQVVPMPPDTQAAFVRITITQAEDIAPAIYELRLCGTTLAGSQLPILEATVNSHYPGLPIDNAVDGNPMTFWAGENALAPPWIIVLKVPRARLERLELDWYEDYGADSFNVQFSEDGVSYLAGTPGGLPGTGNQLVFFPPDAYASFVKITITDAEDIAPAIYELRLFGELAIPLLYTVNFNWPAHILGQPPTVGGGSAPRNTPTSYMGSPQIVDDHGELDGWSAGLTQGDALLFALDDLDPFRVYGWGTRVQLADPAATPRWLARGVDFQLAGAATTTVRLKGNGQVVLLNGKRQSIGQLDPTHAISLWIEVDLKAERIRVEADGQLLHEGPYTNAPTGLTGVGIRARGPACVDDVQVFADNP